MPLNVAYRKLAQEDCRDVFELHRRAFKHGHIAHTIFASPKVGSYLASLIAFLEFQHEHILFGGFHNDQLVSFAYFRGLHDSFHLNDLAVSPNFHGLGIGNDMLEIWRTLAMDYDQRKLSCIVRSDNEIPNHWVQRLGFEQKQKTYIYEQMLGPAESDCVKGIELYGWENAEAWHNSYGFSNFEIRKGDDCWKIDRLGDSYFRVNGHIPPTIKSVLNILDPQRKLLIISDSLLENTEAKLLVIEYWAEADMGST